MNAYATKFLSLEISEIYEGLRKAGLPKRSTLAGAMP
jgi:hypothetical protein